MWVQVAIWFATLLLGELLFGSGAPKPQANDDQLEFPDTRQNRKIPLFCGTVQQRGPLLAWWGDVRKVAMEKTVKTGLFSEEDTIIGYKFYVALQIVIGHGPIDAVTAVHAGRKEAWTGDVASGAISGDQPNLFGPSDGEGGISGTLYIHPGTLTQGPDSYAQTKLTAVPAYAGVAYAMWTNVERDAGGYLGNSKFPPEIWITARRLPKALGSGKHDIGGHANPAEFIYEMLTNTRWGAGMGVDQIDKPSFIAAANTLHSEGMGISSLYTDATDVESIVLDLLEHIDGAIYSDIFTGKRTLVLARADYTLSSQPLFDETNSVLTDFSRPGWDETINEVHVNYRDAVTGEQATVVAQDLANQQIQQAVVSRTFDYPACPTAAQAQKLAWARVRALSLPLAKCTIRADRSAWVLRPGMVIRVSSSQHGFSEMAMRVNRINYGTLDNGQIEVECVQDVFNLSATIYGDVPGTGWTNPISLPSDVRYPLLLEAPYHMTRSAPGVSGAEIGKIITWAAAPAGDAYEYQIYTRQGVAPFQQRGKAPFGPTALLAAAISPVDGTIQVNAGQDIDLLISTDSTGQAQGEGLMLIDNEWMSWQTKATGGSGTYTLSTVYRGVLDTVPAAHAAGARVRFLSGAMGTTPEEYGLTSSVDAKYLTVSGGGILALLTAATQSVTFTQRTMRPYPPADVMINGSSYPVAILGAYTISWKHRDRTAQTTIIPQNTASIGPEAGTTYTLRLYGEDDTLLRTETGLTGTSYTWTAEAADSGLSAGGDPPEDTFDVDSTAQYTQYSGSPATWVISGGELVATGGSQSVFIRNGTSYADVAIEADINHAHNGGLVLRFTDVNNYYVLILSDDSGADPAKNVDLFKRVAGTFTRLTSANITWARGTSKTIRFHAVGTTLSANVGGVQVLTTTDSSHAGPGGVGLRNSDAGGQSKYQAFRWNIQESPETRLNGRVRAEMESVRAGLISHQKHNITVDRAGWSYNWGKYYGDL